MKDDGPLLQDTTASAKLLGAEANLIPFLQSTSAQRVSMSSQHIAHSLPPKRPEHAYIYTGYETIMGHYDFNQTKRDQDVYIIDVIPKYPENKGQYPLKVNPLFTVICIGKDDGLVHYFNMERYGKCTDGYGYRNEWMNTNYLQKDMLIPQDMEFSRATAHIGKSGYGMGVNANAAYITAPEVDNDAVWVSRSLANKFSTVAVSTIAGDIAANQYPLNRYGDAEEYKFLPDIGETVNRDGIICGFRTPTDNTFISDVLTLNTPCPQCDELYYAPPGAEIIDIEFYTGPSKNKIKTDPKLFSQVDKYVEPMYQYWSRIVKVYEEIRDKQYGISPEFNTLVTRCMAMLMSAGKFVKCVNKRPDMKLCAGKEQIEFIRFKVTYAYERPLQLAFKLTDRVGTSTYETSIV